MQIIAAMRLLNCAHTRPAWSSICCIPKTAHHLPLQRVQMLQEMVDAEPGAASDAADDADKGAAKASGKKKRKRAEQAGGNGDKPSTSKAKAAPAAAKPQASSKEDAKVAKLKRICQQAGIAIGPTIYKQQDRVAAFKGLLDKHGLSAASCALPSFA